MDKIRNNNYYYTAFLATILAFTVVILGAYTRLKDAGLGCPDWPLCYGHFIVPKSQPAIESAQKLFPNQIVEPTKAWAEMVHRYFAGILVFLIFLLAIVDIIIRKKNKSHSLKVPLLLMGCVIFQAILGMWTVTWQLLPLVVMGHLLGGMTITTLLWWLTLKTEKPISPSVHLNKIYFLRPWVITGIGIVFLQIFLGGWTSANYASIICPDFPLCQGKFFPPLNFHQAFNFLSPIGQNYQGGLLDVSARVTIQMLHRYGAFITLAYISSLASYILFSHRTSTIKNTAGIILMLLTIQFGLGILNIVSLLYLPIALMHNAVALLLLLSLTTLLYQLTGQPKEIANQIFSSAKKFGELES